MFCMHRSQITAAIASLVLGVGAAGQAVSGHSKEWWLDVEIKAQSVLIDPRALDTHVIIEDYSFPMGVLSPDGKRVAFVGSEPGSDRPFDLYVADVDPAQPSGKANLRRVTTDQDRPVLPRWLPDGERLAFLAGEAPMQQVWCVDINHKRGPIRVSGGAHRAYGLSVLGDGSIVYLEHKGSRQKEQLIDLIVAKAPDARKPGGKIDRRVLLTDQHISSYAISPDGSQLAWSGLGSLFIVDLKTSSTRDIPLHGVHPQLLNHTVHDMSWRPDGKVLAIFCGFLGGVAMPMDAPEDVPWPRMFAEDKIFFVPVNWMPGAEELKVGTTQEDFPSPTADDPQAEVSPPAGDESRPWWVRGLSQRPIRMQWIAAQAGRERVEKTRP